MIRTIATRWSFLSLSFLLSILVCAQHEETGRVALFSEAPDSWQTQRISLMSEVERPGDAALIELNHGAFEAARQADLDRWGVTLPAP